MARSVDTGASEDKARHPETATADYESRFNSIDAELKIIK